MSTFQQLHERALAIATKGKTQEEIAAMQARLQQYDSGQLDCLFIPDAEDNEELCADVSPSEVQQTDPLSKDCVAVLDALQNKASYAYILIAPAFVGQFGEQISPGQLRSALKCVGFDGMIEVAIFADILTLKEALEFDQNIRTEQDYHLTSCCCPMWISMIRKVYGELVPHMPPSVSPMIAAGRTVKKIQADALTVFVGPCVAKKAEAREPGLAGAIDYVLTFQELAAILQQKRIDPASMKVSDREYSSRTGRIYARAGGVSEAVQQTLNKINPERQITIRAQKADGVPACKELLKELREGRHTANFYEGMGCVGGCVGGPKAVIDKAQSTELVDEYGDEAVYPTPIENPYVIEIMRRLGFETVDDLLKSSDIFTRTF